MRGGRRTSGGESKSLSYKGVVKAWGERRERRFLVTVRLRTAADTPEPKERGGTRTAVGKTGSATPPGQEPSQLTMTPSERREDPSKDVAEEGTGGESHRVLGDRWAPRDTGIGIL